MATRFLIIICLLVALGGCGRTDYPPVEVMASDFFIVKKDEKGQKSFVPTREVPLSEGQSYGWAVAIRTNKDPIQFTEQITLSGPASWNVGERKAVVSPDGKSVTVTREAAGHKGLIGGIWGITQGDPEGKASIIVKIEGKVEKVFEFELKKPRN